MQFSEYNVMRKRWAVWELKIYSLQSESATASQCFNIYWSKARDTFSQTTRSSGSPGLCLGPTDNTIINTRSSMLGQERIWGSNLRASLFCPACFLVDNFPYSFQKQGSSTTPPLLEKSLCHKWCSVDESAIPCPWTSSWSGRKLPRSVSNRNPTHSLSHIHF